jgi:hypothetical protein
MGLPVVALLLTGAGVALNAFGQKKQGDAAKAAGEAQKRAADKQAEITDYNAQVAELQATDAVDRGEDAANRYRTQVRGVIGTQRANIAAGNVDVSFGSAVDVQADAAFLGELDAMQLKTNAAREAWGYKVEASNYRKTADVQRQEGTAFAAAGRQQQSAYRWAAAGTLLGGTTTLLQMAYGFKRG